MHILNNKPLVAHLSMFGACAGWGLMAPVGKDAMTHGFDGITMVTFRVVGACLLFWLTSSRFEHHFAYQCINRHHFHAYFCDAVVGFDTEGTDNGKEGYRRAARM